MRDEVLSRAVVAYIWGDRSLSWPSSHPDAVNDLFGAEAADLLLRVGALLAEIHQNPARWFAADLAVTAARVDAAIASGHPELTDEARKALVAHFTYMWK